MSDYILHELLADASHARLLGQSRREHHDLLVVRCHLEDVLYILPHVWKKRLPVTGCVERVWNQRARGVGAHQGPPASCHTHQG